MISDELIFRIRSAFPHVPTPEQDAAIRVFASFMTDRRQESVMMLRGSAGTGKTTLAAAIVRAMVSLKQKLVLMAPTGRAAKVFSLYAGHAAYTIHRRIYRQQSLEGAFSLNFNSAADTLFIVDEASMISRESSGGLSGGSSFGSGLSSLLDDLLQFVYNQRNCRLLLIGDQAQLPPVGEAESPALQSDVLRQYGFRVHESTLNEVLRQSQESGILYNATVIRNMVNYQLSTINCQLPKVRFSGFADIRCVPGDELIESLASSYSRVGLDETMVITRSNKRANIYNQGIRNSILDREDELTTGDLLMVVKNNYYWRPTPDPSRTGGEVNMSIGKSSATEVTNLPSRSGGVGGGFLANGDRCVVRRVRNVQQLYGFRFADVTMTFPDYDDYELTATVLLDTLTAEAPALTADQQALLYNKVMEDYMDIPLKADRLKALKQDRFYNALQVKFAYAATCHKAQGGQWAHVYVDQGYMTDDMLTPDYLHWLYTAFTRATDRLFLVNWPKTQTEDAEVSE